jgi:type III secretory pathway component EscT
VSDVLSDLQGLGLAWARCAPTLAIVPAFGLRALPYAARAILGLALAAGIYPALVPIAAAHDGTPWAALALFQIVLGLPVALAAAIPLWAATMAGGLVDSLRGAGESLDFAVVEGTKASPFGVLLSLIASLVFLSTGGPARVTAALATATLGDHPLLSAMNALVGGIGLAVAIAAPLLAAAVVLELVFALVARAASPAQVHALIAPVRALALLAMAGLLLERMAELVALAVRSNP